MEKSQFVEKQACELLSLSEELLRNVKLGILTDTLESRLAVIPIEQLFSTLNNDSSRKTFWINIYNAFFQILSIKNKLVKPHIFREKHIPIAHIALSLDDIEHGILRRYRWKYSLGYLPNIFAPQIIKQLSVKKMDYRIHFALNCGAVSCPPIAFYSYLKLEKQLETATYSFLSTETSIDTARKVIHASAVMNWFRGDFGGSKGIKRILSKYFETDFSDFNVRFNSYNWASKLHNFERDK